jgi:hypothetical protein
MFGVVVDKHVVWHGEDMAINVDRSGHHHLETHTHTGSLFRYTLRTYTHIMSVNSGTNKGSDKIFRLGLGLTQLNLLAWINPLVLLLSRVIEFTANWSIIFLSGLLDLFTTQEDRNTRKGSWAFGLTFDLFVLQGQWFLVIMLIGL